MTNRYILRPDPAGDGAWQVIDDYATNGFNEPWVEVIGLPLPLAQANCDRLNRWWQRHKRPCTCPYQQED